MTSSDALKEKTSLTTLLDNVNWQQWVGWSYIQIIGGRESLDKANLFGDMLF